MALISKGSPAAKVLAALAPLNLHTGTGNHPNIDITEGTQAFVLGWNERDLSVGFGATATGKLLVLHGGRGRTRLATHDTTTVIVGKGKSRKVHETDELWYGCIFLPLNITGRKKRRRNVSV